MSLIPTPSQTVGPYFALGLQALYKNELCAPETPGALTLSGQLLDGAGAPVADAVLELWQAARSGRYAHPEDLSDLPLEKDWKGFGRVPTDREGRFTFTTVKPGAVPGPAARMQAPHIVVLLGMRGLLRHLMTRIYFPDEPANDHDPILAMVPLARRPTLVAQPTGPKTLRWNINLQGPDETVFFSY